MTEFVDLAVAAQRLREAENILILSHKNPDGDTIGCAGGLQWILRSLGKQAAVLCGDPIPEIYDYMNIEPFEGQFHPDFVVAVDVASVQLLGESELMLEYSENPNLCIDHHGGNTGYAYETVLDPTAAAAAEIITLLAQELEVELTPQIADCLYTGISTDTGCFKFSSTTARTHRIAAQLMEAGANVEELNGILFESRSTARLEIERMALESLEYYLDGACAMVCLTKEQIQESGVAPAELEDLTSLPRSIQGVQVGLTLRQQPYGSYKVSVRTTKLVDACAIANRFGGGGHARAAGCELDGSQESIKELLIQEVAAALEAATARQQEEQTEQQEEV